jgi:hypothetical protein
MMLIIVIHHLINAINESELIRDNSEGRGYHREGGLGLGLGLGLVRDRARSRGMGVEMVVNDVNHRDSSSN